MEMMPYHYHPELEGADTPETWLMALPTFGPRSSAIASDWRSGLLELSGPGLTLREVQVEDAPALFEQLTTEEVARFVSPPPTSVTGFEYFIRWAQRQRVEGRHVCFAVVPEGQTTPVGMFQIRVLDPQQATAEWGFVLGSSYWGTGLFMAGARSLVQFAFGQMGLRRLEARACVANGRGTGALRKLGAVCEAVLHQSFERHGERLDQGLWTILREDWLFHRTVPRATVH